MKDILKKLSKPFPADTVRWKVQTTKGAWSTFVAYVDSRIVAQRLDEATAGMWQDEYSQVAGMLICRISILDPETGKWVSRQDTGVESSEQAQKGHVSDAFKRAAVKFGVGRHLYDMPIIKVKNDPQLPDKQGKPTARGFDGKRIYDATAFCRKAVRENKGGDMIWIDNIKSPESRGHSQPSQPAQSAKGTGRYKALIPYIKKGSDKQKEFVAKILSSSAFSKEERKEWLADINGSVNPEQFKMLLDNLGQEISERKKK